MAISFTDGYNTDQMLKEKRLANAYTITVCVFSCFCQIFSLALFSINFDTLELPARWELQVQILVAISVMASITGYTVKDLRIHTGLLFIRCTSLLLITKPVTYTIGYPLLLFISVATDISCFLPFPINGITGIGLIAIMILKPDSTPVWNQVLAPPPPLSLVEPGVLSIIFLVFAVSLDTIFKKLMEIRSDLFRIEDVNQKLTETNIQFQEYAFDISRKSSETERNRITGEIHDSIGYSLTNIIMTMEAAGDQLKAGKSESLNELLDRSKLVARQCLDEIRKTLRILRAVKEEVPAGVRAIHKLVRNFENIAGIKVVVEYGNIPWSFGTNIDYCLFHIIQESLTNAIRHGNAQHIHIVFWIQEEHILLSIKDDGNGSRAIKEGIGLASMRECITSLGGALTLNNSKNGFTVQTRLPFNLKDHGSSDNQ